MSFPGQEQLPDYFHNNNNYIDNFKNKIENMVLLHNENEMLSEYSFFELLKQNECNIAIINSETQSNSNYILIESDGVNLKYSNDISYQTIQNILSGKTLSLKNIVITDINISDIKNASFTNETKLDIYELLEKFKNSDYISDNRKKNSMTIVGKTLANYNFLHPTFIIGMMGHNESEGNVGLFENYWNRSDQLKYMSWPEELNLPNYIDTFAGRYIYKTDKNGNRINVKEIKNILDIFNQKGYLSQYGFGLGCFQWTFDRTYKLLDKYLDSNNNSDYITEDQVIEAEMKMMIEELQNQYGSVIKKWEDICKNEAIPLESPEAAYWAGYCAVIGYGLSPNSLNVEKKPNHSSVTGTWHNIGIERGTNARNLYNFLMSE